MRARRFAPLAFTMLWLVVALLMWNGEAGSSPDSAGYLSGSATRTLLYPAFLDGCRALGFSVDTIPVVQILIAATALQFFLYALRSRVDSLVLVLGVGLLAAFHPRVMGYHSMILTESIFFSLVYVFTGFLLMYVKSRSARLLLALAIVAGTMAALRPVGLAFVTLVLLLALSTGWRDSWQRLPAALVLVIVPVVLLFGGEQVLHRHVHGPEAQGLGPKHVFGKAAMIHAPQLPTPVDSVEAAVQRVLDEDAAAVRDFIANAPDFHTRASLTTTYETLYQHRYNATLREAVGVDETQWLTAVERVGRQRLASAPDAYLELTAIHYFGLWNLFGDSHPSSVHKLESYLAAHEPIPHAEFLPWLTGGLTVSRTAQLSRPVIQILAIVALGLAFLGLLTLFSRKRLASELEAAGLLGLQVHGYFLLIALTGISILRYTLAVWPMMLTAGLLLAWTLMPSSLRPRFRRW